MEHYLSLKAAPRGSSSYRTFAAFGRRNSTGIVTPDLEEGLLFRSLLHLQHEVRSHHPVGLGSAQKLLGAPSRARGSTSTSCGKPPIGRIFGFRTRIRRAHCNLLEPD